jgi:hypothetical protein
MPHYQTRSTNASRMRKKKIIREGLFLYSVHKNLTGRTLCTTPPTFEDTVSEFKVDMMCSSRARKGKCKRHRFDMNEYCLYMKGLKVCGDVIPNGERYEKHTR